MLLCTAGNTPTTALLRPYTTVNVASYPLILFGGFMFSGLAGVGVGRQAAKGILGEDQQSKKRIDRAWRQAMAEAVREQNEKEEGEEPWTGEEIIGEAA